MLGEGSCEKPSRKYHSETESETETETETEAESETESEAEPESESQPVRRPSRTTTSDDQGTAPARQVGSFWVGAPAHAGGGSFFERPSRKAPQGNYSAAIRSSKFQVNSKACPERRTTKVSRRMSGVNRSRW
jgi:hypothetical protein